MSTSTDSATVAEFRQSFATAAFNALADAKIESAFAVADHVIGYEINPTAHSFVTAHVLALDVAERESESESTPALAADGGAGVVTRESIGPRDIEYTTTVGNPTAEGAGRRAWLAQTSYGRTAQTLLDATPSRIMGIMVA